MSDYMAFESQRLLKAAEVARILNISRALSYRLLETGELPTVRIRKAVRVKPQDLFEYIDRQRRGEGTIQL